MFGLQHPLTCKPWTTLSNPCNKVRAKYFSKEVFLRLPSCVFIMRRLFMRLSLILCRCDAEWWCRWLYNTRINAKIDLFPSNAFLKGSQVFGADIGIPFLSAVMEPLPGVKISFPSEDNQIIITMWILASQTASVFWSASDISEWSWPWLKCGVMVNAGGNGEPSSNPKRSRFIFTNPSDRAGYDTRSIFKRSLTGLNSEFSFS